MVTEIDRLMAMKAVQRTALHNLEKEEETGTESGEKERTGTKWLTTKLVFGWHFRERKWIRRARLVAREFKTQEHRTSLVSLFPFLGYNKNILCTPELHRCEGRFLTSPAKEQMCLRIPKGVCRIFQ